MVLRIKFIFTLLLICVISFGVNGCAEHDIPLEELVGVWQAEVNPDAFEPPRQAVYITEDGNLYFLVSFPTPWGTFGTRVYHYCYEISGSRLLLSMPPDGVRVTSHDIGNAQISVRNSVILLDLQEGEDGHSWFRESLYNFHKVADEIPYGWTDEDNQEIRALNARINEGLLAIAKQFSEAIDVRILLTDDSVCEDLFSYHDDNYFLIGDIPAKITFTGDTPTHRYHQRYERLSGERFSPALTPSLLESGAIIPTSASMAPAYQVSTIPAVGMSEVIWLISPTAQLTEARSASGQFSLRICEMHNEVPEEWFTAFEALDYAIIW